MSYFDGMLTPVKAGVTREEYLAFAERTAPVLIEHGALRVVEGFGDDVPHGKLTDFYRAVAAEEGETVALSWIEWPDKATRDAAWPKVMEDPRLQEDVPTPFVGARMVYGGFAKIMDLKAGGQ
jgi:uncharacterized protein YbaA (DUF1428 family)